MLRGSLLMILVVLFYSGNILTGKAINDLPPFTIAFLRLLFAFLVLAPFAWRTAWKHRHLFLEKRRPFFWMTITGVTFFNTFIYASLQFTTASNVAVLETAIPAVTILLAAILLSEKLGWRQWTGAAVSGIGALIVVTEGALFTGGGIEWNPGDVLMIGAILCWSAYSLLVKTYMGFFPAFAAVFVMNGLSVVILLPFTAAEWFLLGLPQPGMPETAGIVYLGIFPSIIALILFNKAVGEMGAAKASVFLNLLPVFTMTGAAAWLNETIRLPHIGGALIVMMGVWMTASSRGKDKK
ncbi:DMT family transporter [Alkalicoccus luteus]